MPSSLFNNQQNSNFSPNSQMVQMARNSMNMLRTMANPQQAVMQMARQNPALGAVMQMCNGRNPKDVFYEQCKLKGINPDDVLNQLK